MRSIALTPVALLTLACSPTLTVDVLQPAEVELPQEVQRIVVVDAAAPSSTGQEILSGLEGLVSAEGLYSDRDAREAALQELVAVLDSSPRYEAVLVDTIEGTSIWDKELSHHAISDVAYAWDADAVLALTAFDSDSDITELVEAVVPNKDESEAEQAEEIVKYILTRDTKIVASWTVYDADGYALDRLREHRLGSVFDAEGETIEEALAGLPDGRSVVRGLALDAAREYGARIAPLWIEVDRPMYGEEELSPGVRMAQSGDMAGAIRFFQETIRSTGDLELAGKASYNLAVCHEAKGSLSLALAHAEQAHDLIGRSRTGDYVSELAWLLGA